MHVQGQIVRIIKRVALVVLSLSGAVVVLAILGMLIPYPPSFEDAKGSALSRHILVVANSIHTDIAIPVDPQSLAAFGFLADTGLPVTNPAARWLLFGWGGRSFYMETPTLADIKPGPTFRALTIDSSVMHVDVFTEIFETDPAVTPIVVSEAAYANLLATISASFTRRDGKVEPIAGFAFGTADKFYEAEGSFNALLGCNLWTSRMLRSAGLSTGVWNPLPPSLAASLRLFDGDRLGAVQTTEVIH